MICSQTTNYKHCSVFGRYLFSYDKIMKKKDITEMIAFVISSVNVKSTNSKVKMINKTRIAP